jgi:hypothetical protein
MGLKIARADKLEQNILLRNSHIPPKATHLHSKVTALLLPSQVMVPRLLNRTDNPLTGHQVRLIIYHFILDI